MTRIVQVVKEEPSLTEYATEAETCALLNVGAVWVYRLIRMGKLEVVRYKRRNYMTRASIEERLAEAYF